MLSDALKEFGDEPGDDAVEMLAFGCLTPAHAGQFKAFVKQVRSSFSLAAILRGEIGWPHAPEDRDILYFLSQLLRARLIKDLPAVRESMTDLYKDLAHRAKALIKDLAAISFA